MLEEFGDTDPRWEDDQILFESKQQVIDLSRLGFGLDFRDLAQGQGVLLTTISKQDAVTPATVLQSSHQYDSNVTATMLPKCYQVFTGQQKRTQGNSPKSFPDKLPKRGLEPPRD